MQTRVVQDGRKRSAYLDLVRVAACFFVIINHTNPAIYASIPPTGATWYVSMLYHYVCRMNIPLFVMVSGALLLPKQESYAAVGKRIVRIVLLLAIFTVVNYLIYAPWQKGIGNVLLGVPGALLAAWREPAVGSYWYLYMYAGLLVMMPFLRFMVQGMKKKKDYRVFIAIWLVADSGLILLNHYLPNAAPNSDFSLPLFGAFVGELVAGLYIHKWADVTQKGVWLSVIGVAACVFISVVLTRIEYDVVQGSVDFLFLDWRIHPSIFMNVAAMCSMYLAKAWFETRAKAACPQWLKEMSACTLVVYLLHQWVIDITRNSVYLPMADRITAMPAMALWDMLIFVLCIAAAVVIRRMPGLRKLL